MQFIKMRTLKKQYGTLAIIGNGFDLAHGYKTSYEAFSENTNAESLKKFKSYCDNESEIETWYNFEENILQKYRRDKSQKM